MNGKVTYPLTPTLRELRNACALIQCLGGVCPTNPKWVLYLAPIPKHPLTLL